MGASTNIMANNNANTTVFFISFFLLFIIFETKKAPCPQKDKAYPKLLPGPKQGRVRLID